MNALRAAARSSWCSCITPAAATTTFACRWAMSLKSWAVPKGPSSTRGQAAGGRGGGPSVVLCRFRGRHRTRLRQGPRRPVRSRRVVHPGRRASPACARAICASSCSASGSRGLAPGAQRSQGAPAGLVPDQGEGRVRRRCRSGRPARRDRCAPARAGREDAGDEGGGEDNPLRAPKRRSARLRRCRARALRKLRATLDGARAKPRVSSVLRAANWHDCAKLRRPATPGCTRSNGMATACSPRSPRARWQLWSRNGLPWNDRLPEIARRCIAGPRLGAARWRADRAGCAGRSDFNALQKTSSGERNAPLIYMMFDCPTCRAMT